MRARRWNIETFWALRHIPVAIVTYNNVQRLGYKFSACMCSATQHHLMLFGTYSWRVVQNELKKRRTDSALNGIYNITRIVSLVLIFSRLKNLITACISQSEWMSCCAAFVITYGRCLEYVNGVTKTQCCLTTFIKIPCQFHTLLPNGACIGSSVTLLL